MDNLWVIYTDPNGNILEKVKMQKVTKGFVDRYDYAFNRHIFEYHEQPFFQAKIAFTGKNYDPNYIYLAVLHREDAIIQSDYTIVVRYSQTGAQL